jgi:hypothetical protein
MKIKRSKFLHISFAIMLMYCVQFYVNSFISFTQFSKKLIASFRDGDSLVIAAKKGFLAMKESEYRRDNIFIHKVTAASPTCAITAPAAGTVFGTVSVTANATSSKTITGVQFKLDGTVLNAQDTTAPYSTSWNTTLSTNAAHSLTCVTTNQYAETTESTPVSVVVDNAPPLRQNGAPSTTLSAGTTQTNISLTTTENAICKYSTSASTAYASMTALGTNALKTVHSQNITGLTNGVTYIYYVLCQDQFGNTNPDNYPISFSIANASSDIIAPSVPQGLATTVISIGQVNLAWSASADNIAVAGYKIYRDGVQIANTTSLSYADMTVTAATTYSYRISAYDTSFNESVLSTAVIAQTPAAVIVQPITTTVAAVVVSDDSSDGKKDEPAPKRVIKQNYSKIKKGSVLIQSGKRFTKNSDVALYFSRLDATYFPPKKVRTTSKGTFSLSYAVNKAYGKYKWYAVDLKTGRKSKTLTYSVVGTGTNTKAKSSVKKTKSS